MGWPGRLLAIAALVPAGAIVSKRVSLRASIINGSLVDQASGYHAMFALPTGGLETDEWLGCGASIISPTFALTSAHCFGGGKQPCSGPKHLALWVGDVQLVDSGNTQKVLAGSDGQSFRVEADLVCHPAFDGKCSHGNDIALLRLRERVPSWVRPVTLNLGSGGSIGEGDTVTAIGHGLHESSLNPDQIAMDYSPSLRQVSVTVLPHNSADCGRVLAGGYGCSDEFSEGPASNVDMQLCAGAADEPERDTCAGDSGSPMMDAAGAQVGIVSYGGGPGTKLSGSGRMCGDPRYPGIYSRVSSFRSFILENVADLPQ